jgi:hypothetical protein
MFVRFVDIPTILLMEILIVESTPEPDSKISQVIGYVRYVAHQRTCLKKRVKERSIRPEERDEGLTMEVLHVCRIES